MNGKQDRIKETKSINKSLFFLTQVISQLSKGCKDIHVPYRNSTLTKLLKNSLGGNARTALVLCISPAEGYLPHTLSTLRFGVSARRVCNNVKTNVYESCNLASLKNQIQAYEHRINQLELDNSKQRNESEEPIEMVKRLMDQKKELVERLVQLQNDPKMIAAPELLSKERNQVIAQTMSIHMELEQAILKHSTVINSLSPSKPSASKVDYHNTPKQVLPDLKAQARAARLVTRVAALKQRLAKDRQHNRKQTRLLVELLGSADLRPTTTDHTGQTAAGESVWAALSDNTLRMARRRVAGAMKRLNKELMRREVGKGVQRVLGQLGVQNLGQPSAAATTGTTIVEPSHELPMPGIVDLLKSLSWAGCTDNNEFNSKGTTEPIEEEAGCLGKRRPIEGLDGLEGPAITQSRVSAKLSPSQTELARGCSNTVLDILMSSGLLETQTTLEADLRILPDSLHESLIRSQMRKEHSMRVEEAPAMLIEQSHPQLETWIAPVLVLKPQHQTIEQKPLALGDCFSNLVNRSVVIEDDDVISVLSGCDLLDGNFEFNTGKIPITAQKGDNVIITVVDDGLSQNQPKADCNMISIVDLTKAHRGQTVVHQVDFAPEVVLTTMDDAMSHAALSFQDRPHQVTKGSHSKFNKLAGKPIILDGGAPQRPTKPVAQLPTMLLEKVAGHSLEVPVPRHVISRSLSDQQALELEHCEESPEKHSDRTDSEHNIFHRPQRRLDFHCPQADFSHVLRQRPNNEVVLVSPQKTQLQSGSKDQAKFMTPQSGRNSSVYHYTMNKQEQTGAFSFDRSSNKVHRRLDTDLLRVAMSPKENKPSGALKSAGGTKLTGVARHKVQPVTSRFTARR